MSSENWSKWHNAETDAEPYLGCQVRTSVSNDGWIHFLLAPPDEPDPRNNHVHIKYYDSVKSTPVLCGITEEGSKSHSRKMLIERINEVTGLNLSYK